MNFVPLHAYSGYSILKSGLRLEDYVKQAKSFSYPAIALTDFELLSGAPKFVSLCKEKSLKPIIGEDFIIDNLLFTFIVKNEEGYKNILKLSLAVQDKKRNLFDLKQYFSDLIVIVSSNNRFDVDMTKQFAKLSRGIDDFYIGLEPNNEDYMNSIRNFAFDHGYPLVAFPFVKYVKPEDEIVCKILNAVSNKEKLTDKSSKGNEYLYDINFVNKLFKESEISLTIGIANKVDFEFVQKRGKMVSFKNDLGLTSDEYLKKIAFEGLKKLNKETNEYNERLNNELQVISSMGYSDYFLVVKDYIDFARNNDISVGPGRGSAVGSLVSYVLGITQGDPIKYNLIFERFLNKGRQTLPDIDVDFKDSNRDDVVEYIRRKYSNKNVAKIIAFQKFGAKAALRDIGSVFNYPERDIELFTKLIRKEDEKLTLRELYKRVPEFKALVNEDKYYLEIVSLASKIEGFPRQLGMHAAGIVINDESLEESIPLIKDYDGKYIEQFEKDYLEEQSFLKMDILSLTNLTIVDDCIERINKNYGIKIDRDEIPYDDPKALEQIKSTKTMGLFQIESFGMRKSIKILKPSTFEDVVALISLYRPGPLDNIEEYANHKFKKTKQYYASKVLEEILSPTYGVLVYQEQVMQIANKMAGFSFAEADLLRRAISKKDAKKLASYQAKFIEGAIKNGYSEKEANDVYKLIYKFGDYGFNKSHAIGYALLTCRMAYLKAHYPKEFYASILTNSNSEHFSTTLSEMKASKIKVANPDINVSTNSYIVKGNTIVFPLTSVKGIMNITSDAIIKERAEKPFTDFFDFVVRMNKYKINSKQIISLIDAGAFDKLECSRASLRLNIPTALNYASMLGGINGETIIDISMFPKPSMQRCKDDSIFNLNKEFDSLGLMISGSPLQIYKDRLKNVKTISIADIPYSSSNIKIACIIRNVKTIKTKNGKPMAFANIYDDSGELEITIFTDAYQKSFDALKKNTSILINGYYKQSTDELVVKEISKLEDLING